MKTELDLDQEQDPGADAALLARHYRAVSPDNGQDSDACGNCAHAFNQEGPLLGCRETNASVSDSHVCDAFKRHALERAANAAVDMAIGALGRPPAPSYLRISPTMIKAALKCPALYHYRYVEGLEPRRTPSVLAFGRAIHAAIAAAYARVNVPMTPEEVADVFAVELVALDNQGISYKDGEALEDRHETKTVRGKEQTVLVPGLLTEGRALAATWWMTQRDAVLAVKVEGTEVPLTWDLDVGLAVTCRVDVAERDGPSLDIGDHKTASGWGPSDEQEASQSIQVFTNCLLWWRCRGEMPDRFYFTVLKKTKTPEVFRYYLPAPSREALAAFEDQLRAFAALMRHHQDRNYPVRNIHRDCGWCSFAPLCWGVDGAREMFTTREERDKRRGKTPEPEPALDGIED